MRALIIALTFAALAACAPAVTPAPSGGDGAVSPPVGATAEASACQARGGALRRICRMQSIQCVVSYADAGRACRDGDDCQGDCRVDAGATLWG